MAEEILDLLTTAIVNVGSWFTQILEVTGMKTVYLVYVFIFLSVSILLMPVIGGRISLTSADAVIRKSDRVRRQNSSSSSQENN